MSATSKVLCASFFLVVCLVEALDFNDFRDICETSGIDKNLEVGGIRVSCGRTVDISAPTTGPPSVKFINANVEKQYLILMVDPDAPSSVNPTARSWLHWLKKDVEGAALQNGQGSSGTDVVEYNPPTPPHGSGYHRYYTFAFEQPTSFSLTDPPSGRSSFSVSTFIDDNHLGDPVAVNMYKTQRT